MKRVLIAAVAALSMTGVASAEEFDLVCNGKQSLVSYRGSIIGEKEFSKRIRISTTTSQWCEDSCDSVRPMIVSPSSFSLNSMTSINRINGALLTRFNSRFGTLVEEAHCHRQAFSGFPAARF